MDLGEGVTPGIPFVLPCSFLWGRNMELEPPIPSPLKQGFHLPVRANRRFQALVPFTKGTILVHFLSHSLQSLAGQVVYRLLPERLRLAPLPKKRQAPEGGRSLGQR